MIFGHFFCFPRKNLRVRFQNIPGRGFVIFLSGNRRQKFLSISKTEISASGGPAGKSAPRNLRHQKRRGRFDARAHHSNFGSHRRLGRATRRQTRAHPDRQSQASTNVRYTAVLKLAKVLAQKAFKYQLQSIYPYYVYPSFVIIPLFCTI